MTLDECRRFYAEEIRLAAKVGSTALIEAFARLPRENFLGPGPLLGKALSTGALLRLKSVRVDPHEQTDTCILHGRDVCMSSADAV